MRQECWDRSRRSRTRLLLVLLWAALLATTSGCGPQGVRGGPGTGNAELDNLALSTKLDRQDIDYLVSENIGALSRSRLWNEIIERAQTPPIVAIWPIQNASTQHIDDQMDALLSSIETYLVNSGDVRVVNRERQKKLVNELRMRQTEMYDSETLGRLGRQLGAQYFVTGKITSVEERLQRTRRAQYSLVLQVLEIETGLITFQNEAVRSKAVKG